MSVPNAGPIVANEGLVAAAEHDTRRGSAFDDPATGLEEADHPVAPDQFDPKYETTKWEV